MIKSLEQLRYYVSNNQYREVIDSFLKFKALTQKILDQIEQSILNATIQNTPKEMLGVYDDLGTIDIIDWVQNISVNESDQVLKGIKQTKSNIQKLVKSYEMTLKKYQNGLLDVLNKTLNNVENQIEYKDDITVMRLKKRDEGIGLETNGILFDGQTAAVCVFQAKLDGVILKGFLQPALFDGLYFEQPLNFKETPHTIKYSLHKGLDLRNPLYEEEVILFDPEIEKVDPFNYLIKFKQNILLELNCTYSLCASTGQDSFFGTQQYYEREQDNPFIKFCDQTYSVNKFKLPENRHFEQIFCEADRGLFTALIVSEDF